MSGCGGRLACYGGNLVLIGMPGVGKSTVGVLLAKALSRGFLDTDVQIQVQQNESLQAIIEARGLDVFLGIEQQYVQGLACSRHVIATGGSVVYGEAAMRHLRGSGITIHLDVPFDLLEDRITNLATRGVVMGRGQTLTALFEERAPLYRRYADVTVRCGADTADQVVAALIGRLEEHLAPPGGR